MSDAGTHGGNRQRHVRLVVRPRAPVDASHRDRPVPVADGAATASWATYLLWVRRSWWIVVLTTLLGGAISGAVLARSEPTWTSEARVALTIDSDQIDPTDRPAATAEIDSELVTTVGELLESPAIRREALRAVPADVATGDPTVTSTPSLLGYTVSLSVTTIDGAASEQVADAVLAEVTAAFEELYPGFSLAVIAPAERPESADPDGGALTVTVGLLVGLGAGLLVAVGRGAATLDLRSPGPTP